MRKDYQNMQKNLLPSQEKQEMIWNMIEKNTYKRQKKYRCQRMVVLSGTIAAAILVIALCLPQTGLAESVKGIMRKFFYKDTDIVQDVRYDVYEDCDEHIRMKIEEMLSDGACIYFNICYEALDEEGERWLSKLRFDVAGTGISFVAKDHDLENTTGWSEILEEQVDLAIDGSRYFAFLHFDDSGNYHLKDVKRTLSYSMYDGQAEGKITLNSNLETFSYRLSEEGSPHPDYEPKYLYVSKLSYGLMGINKGVYRVTYDYGSKGYVSEHLDEYELDLIFIMKDGSKINAAEYGTTTFSPAIGNPDFDLRIAAGYFNKKGDPDNYLKNLTIHPENLVGLDINGIHYNLVPESEYNK